MNNSPRHNRGFTLLELLTATAIASLLVVMLVGVFNQANRAWTTGEEQAEVYQMGRAVMDLMARDLSQVRVTPRCIFDGQANQLSFYAAVCSDKSQRSDLDLVRYNYSSGDCSLARTNTLGTVGTTLGETILSSNLISFTVGYYTNRNSGTDHRLVRLNPSAYNSTNNAPSAMEVTLGLLPSRRADAYWKNPGARNNITNTYLRVFSQMIYIPNSRP